MTDSLSTTKLTTVMKFPDIVAHDVSLIGARCPYISAKIAQLWGTVDLNKYLNSIVFDERGGRQGFPEPTASALFRVYYYHQSFMRASKNQNDIWDTILDQLK
ncbi:MAG: hypothetical protein WA632_01460 [Gallionella sp.]